MLASSLQLTNSGKMHSLCVPSDYRDHHGNLHVYCIMYSNVHYYTGVLLSLSVAISFPHVYVSKHKKHETLNPTLLPPTMKSL